MRQLSLNEEGAVAVTQKAIDRVEKHAEPNFIVSALMVIQDIPHGHFFTTDEVWDRLTGISAPHEPRVMGAIIRMACRFGMIAETRTTQKSRRVECHRRPLAIWRRL